MHRLGGLGYVGSAEEVRVQEIELGFRFDYFVVSTVTRSTPAGMLVGFPADSLQRRVIGIDASGTPWRTRTQATQIASNTAELVGLDHQIVDGDAELMEDYAYPVYGVPSRETDEAIRHAAQTEGMLTDPVYEGTSMQGLVDLIRKGFSPTGTRVLYAHLGGVPAINAYSYRYRNG